MTVKLYEQYPYEVSFQAHVISCVKCHQGYDTVLDQTLFFPEEGGQNCDKGTIQNIDVNDVQIKNDTIHHYLSMPIEGKVTGMIDFAYRYSNMQNHSGEHILSGLVHSLYGFHNVGFHLGDHEITTDYDGFLTKEQLETIENKVNQVIQDNKFIKCYYPDNIEQVEYRSKKEIDGDIRIVEIEDVDICACCAPHVRSTSEIGLFKIVKAIKHKKGIRIYFLCGQKAIEDYRSKHEEVMTVSNLLSSPPYSISQNVQRVLDENNQLKQTITILKKQMIDQLCQTIKQQKYHIEFVEDMDRSLQQYYVHQLLSKSTYMAAVFVGVDHDYRFLMASLDDARIYMNLLKEKYVVKGGGKKDMVQGVIEASKEEILDVLQNNM